MRCPRSCLFALPLLVAGCGQIVAPIADAQESPDGTAGDRDAAPPLIDAASPPLDAAPPPLDAAPLDAAPLPTDGATSGLTLTVVLDGAGVGDVKSVPSGIACAPICAEAFPTNTTVILAATPHVGAYFAGWSEPACGMAVTCTVVVTAPREIVAKFEVVP